MAKEVKFINDSMMCYSHAWGVQKAVKDCRFIEYILVLETVIFPWKIPWKVFEVYVSENVRTMINAELTCLLSLHRTFYMYCITVWHSE